MKTRIYFLFLILFVCRAGAAAIEAKAVYLIRHPTPTYPREGAISADDLKDATIFLYLKNVGTEEIRLPTEQLASAQYHDRSIVDLLILELTARYLENPLGIEVVTPEAKLGVVKLKPGETTLIILPISIDERRSRKIQLSYEVKREFAQKYDFWFGKISTLVERTY